VSLLSNLREVGLQIRVESQYRSQYCKILNETCICRKIYLNLWAQCENQREIDYKKQEVFDAQTERGGGDQERRRKYLMNVEHLLSAVCVFFPALIPGIMCKVKCKGKAIPVTGREGP
jgi:hypothetical protein